MSGERISYALFAQKNSASKPTGGKNSKDSKDSKDGSDGSGGKK